MFVENKAVNKKKQPLQKQPPEVFLKISQKLHEKTWGLQLKNGTRAKVFSCEYCKISKHFFTEHFRGSASAFTFLPLSLCY